MSGIINLQKMTKKLNGRPTKTPKRGTRVSLGLKVTAKCKNLIEKGARASGRTQSQQAEFLIEKALARFSIEETIANDPRFFRAIRDVMLETMKTKT